MAETVTRPHMVLRRFSSFAEQEAADVLFYRERSVPEKMQDVADMALAYAKNHRIDTDAQGPKELLSAFNEHGVEYVIVGGHAVSAYGFSRMTKDLDILIRSTRANAEKVFLALATFGAPLSTYTVADFYDHPTDVIQFGVPPARIDILQSLSAVEDAEIWSSISNMPVDGEITAPFISLENLIRNKLQAGRPRDLSDVDELKKVNGL